MKYKPSDLVKIYKDTPTFIDGQICVILDKDPNDGSLSVAPLEVTAMEEYDTMRLLQNHSKWVETDRIEKITFDKPKKSLKLVNALLFGVLVGLAVGLYGL